MPFALMIRYVLRACKSYILFSREGRLEREVHCLGKGEGKERKKRGERTLERD